MALPPSNFTLGIEIRGQGLISLAIVRGSGLILKRVSQNQIDFSEANNL